MSHHEVMEWPLGTLPVTFSSLWILVRDVRGVFMQFVRASATERRDVC